ncbi:MAG: TIR domain-containing protein [Nodosilinea sp.]
MSDSPHPTYLTAQVFLAYAAEDWPSAEERGQNCAASSPAVAAIAALRQLLTEAQIAHWECQPCRAADDSESVISRAAEACDNYLLVLTPRTLTDALCLQGLLFALSMNKRIVPVLAETVPVACLPEPLQALSMIDLQTTASLGQTAEGCQLVQALRHEASYHQAHTQLLVKALQWERQLRDPALLLNRAELASCQLWLEKAKLRSRYRPIQLQTLYVATSARHWNSRGIATQTVGWLKQWLD